MADFIEYTNNVGGKSYVRKSAILALNATKSGTQILIGEQPDQTRDIGSITATESPEELMDRILA